MLMTETNSDDSDRVCGGPTKSGGRCQITLSPGQSHCYMHPNEFDCPDCGLHHDGWPESCADCGVSFSWKSATESYYDD